MIVVSDSGPVHYLVLTDLINILETLYGELLIPSAVVAELSHDSTPSAVKSWISNAPTWVSVRSPKKLMVLPDHLGAGEIEAISLAIELNAGLLIDDLDARKFVAGTSLVYSGMLGVLIEAHSQNLVNIESSISRLRQTTFRISDALAHQVIEMARMKTP